MKKTLEKYLLEKWWVSTSLLLLAAFAYALSLGSANQQLCRIIDNALIAAAVLIIASAIWQFVKGYNHRGNTQILIFILTFMAVSFMTMLFSISTMFGPSTDTFASDLELPKNVELNYPISLDTADRPDEIMLAPPKMNDFMGAEFQLYSSFQPGLYEYDLWLRSKTNGTVYLKAFEITQNIQLSNSRLREKSTLEVQANYSEVKRFSNDHNFTIYEGDFGQPYGARFEVWFIPSGTRREFKILEKNYVIEGWMR